MKQKDLRELRSVDGIQFEKNGYEYNVVYEDSLANFVGIYRREIGKRKFRYYKGFGTHEHITCSAAMERAQNMAP